MNSFLDQMKEEHYIFKTKATRNQLVQMLQIGDYIELTINFVIFIIRFNLYYLSPCGAPIGFNLLYISSSGPAIEFNLICISSSGPAIELNLLCITSSGPAIEFNLIYILRITIMVGLSD
jgi:hypothetical protein